ncbi:MAG TPA: hypothetical protein VJT32_11040 [bacterium]|nr:hypothetical protein [bacterium]
MTVKKTGGGAAIPSRKLEGKVRAAVVPETAAGFVVEILHAWNVQRMS